MKPSVLIREVQPGDLPYLKLLFDEGSMQLPPVEELTCGMVAIDDESKSLVGFIRILQVRDDENPLANGNYVYPVIVFKNWQRFGVGRALIKEAHERYGELKLVACKASREFYPKCGFDVLKWDEVAQKVATDCTYCPDLTSCSPQPFILR